MPENDRPEDHVTENESQIGEHSESDDTGEWPMYRAPSDNAEGENLRLSDVAVPLDEEEEDEETARVAIPESLRKKPDPPVVDSSARVAAAISQLGNQIEERFSTLQAFLDREVRAEASRERVVDRLHGELQEYKQDLLLKVQRPIFIDLIQLHDDIGKMAEAQPIDDESRGTSIRGAFESIRTAIEDILYRQGVEPFHNDAEEFDPRRQRALSAVPTDQPELNRTIAIRHRPGFQAGEKVIRPELVSVHTLRK